MHHKILQVSIASVLLCWQFFLHGAVTHLETFEITTATDKRGESANWNGYVIKRGFDLGNLTHTKQINLPLPEKIGERHLVYIMPSAQVPGDDDAQSLKNKQLMLYITKEQPKKPSIKHSWTIHRYILSSAPTFNIELTTPLGRIAGDSDNFIIPITFSSSGALEIESAGQKKFKLFQFTPDQKKSTDSAGNYTLKSLSFNALPDYYGDPVKTLNLGHKMPVLLTGITEFAGLGSKSYLNDCSGASVSNALATMQSDHPVCTYYGFSDEAVKEQLDAMKKDGSPVAISCELILPKVMAVNSGSSLANWWSQWTSNKDEIPADQSPYRPRYTVPAANCDPEITDRACFHNVAFKSFDQFRWYDDPQSGSAYCPSGVAQVTCGTKDAQGKNIVYTVPTRDMLKSTQREACTLLDKNTGDPLPLPEPVGARCIIPRNLRIAQPISCSVGSSTVACKLKDYSYLPPFSAHTPSCKIDDQKNACTLVGEPIPGTCK